MTFISCHTLYCLISILNFWLPFYRSWNSLKEKEMDPKSWAVRTQDTEQNQDYTRKTPHFPDSWSFNMGRAPDIIHLRYRLHRYFTFFHPSYKFLKKLQSIRKRHDSFQLYSIAVHWLLSHRLHLTRRSVFTLLALCEGILSGLFFSRLFSDWFSTQSKLNRRQL